MKIMSTGDGGMIFTYNKQLAERIRKLLFFGLDTPSGFSSSKPTRWWEFDVSEPGRNATMNDVTSAIGLVQLKKLPAFVDVRKRLYEHYISRLRGLTQVNYPPPVPIDCDSSYYFFYITVQDRSRDELAAYLREKDIYTTFRYYPLHKISLYGDDKLPLQKAEFAADNILCLPLHQAMTEADVDLVCDEVIAFYSKERYIERPFPRFDNVVMREEIRRNRL